MKPNKLQLTSGHLSRGLVGIGPGTPSTSSWERPTMAGILFMVGIRKGVGFGVLVVLETQSSRRKERTEGEADEPRTEANRQS